MCFFCECKLFLTCSDGGAMTGWNGSNFLFLVGGRRTCGQAQNVAKGPASWAQRSRVVEKESRLTIEFTLSRAIHIHKPHSFQNELGP